MIASCFKWGQDVAAGWNRFWFDSRSDSDLVLLGLFRLCFAAVMLFCYSSRTFDLGFFYSEDGILPSAHRVTVEMYRFRPTPLDGVSSIAALQGRHALCLLSLLALSLGFYTRVAAVAGYVLHMVFLNRNLAVQFGVDTIGTFFLLYLCFAQCGARYSLDSWLRPRARRQTGLSHVAWRLMQLQVCIVYGYSGMEKLKGSRWWDGSAFWDVLSAGNLQRFDMSFVSHVPIVIATVVYVVLLWEVYFPALVWVPKLRLPMLAFGVAMHIGIFLFMNLPSFGFMMISFYILFLKEQEILRGLSYCRSRIPL
ncbi:MAG: HTTM domain-containing protein [Bdellovibrionota bacterium]